MISTDELADYQAAVIGALEAGLKQAAAAGCGIYRLRKISFNGEVVFSTSQIAQQITDNEQLAPSVTTTEELQSTNRAETLADHSTQDTQRGGSKIFGRRSESQE